MEQEIVKISRDLYEKNILDPLWKDHTLKLIAMGKVEITDKPHKPYVEISTEAKYIPTKDIHIEKPTREVVKVTTEKPQKSSKWVNVSLSREFHGVLKTMKGGQTFEQYIKSLIELSRKNQLVY